MHPLAFLVPALVCAGIVYVAVEDMIDDRPDYRLYWRDALEVAGLAFSLAGLAISAWPPIAWIMERLA